MGQVVKRSAEHCDELPLPTAMLPKMGATTVARRKRAKASDGQFSVADDETFEEAWAAVEGNEDTVPLATPLKQAKLSGQKKESVQAKFLRQPIVDSMRVMPENFSEALLGGGVW